MKLKVKSPLLVAWGGGNRALDTGNGRVLFQANKSCYEVKSNDQAQGADNTKGETAGTPGC